VWSLLCSFCQARRKLRVGKVGGPLLKLDAKTVGKAVYRLGDRNLLNGMTAIIPDQDLALFRGRARMHHFLNFLPSRTGTGRSGPPASRCAETGRACAPGVVPPAPKGRLRRHGRPRVLAMLYIGAGYWRPAHR
jgi:hypothetical protein